MTTDAMRWNSGGTNMNRSLAVCEHPKCAKHFEPRRQDSRFCSRVCAKRAYDKTRPHHRGKKLKFFDLPFNSFDGEGESPDGEGSDRFTLLADSTGRELWHADRSRLTTDECLAFLVESPKRKANVWYSFGYDVANILYDLPREKLNQLRENNHVWYGRYRITWIPTKQFAITWRAANCRCTQKQGGNTRRASNCEHVRSFLSHDVFGYFQTGFLATMKGWYKTQDPEIVAMIERGKDARGSFHTWDMTDVIAYNRAELVVCNEIMNNFREALRAADYRVSAWSGAGTLAAHWLRREKADQYFADLPQEMHHARDCAFFGGRIDAAVIGTINASEGDIQSAYPANVATLPDMRTLRWHHVKGQLPRENVGLVHVKWNLSDNVRWGPFPYRESDGSAKYPLDGEGWYHAVEVRAAIRRFGDDIEIIESWEARGTFSYPFAEPVRRDYALRASYKHANPPNPAHIPLKLGLNSLYGKFAQRAGIKLLEDGTLRMPRYHNLFYAGMITAGARARISDAILAHGDANVLMIATDGVFVRGKWKLIEPDDLGSWEVDAKTKRVIIAGAGMYETRTADGKTNKNKRRGFGGSRIDYADVIRRWRRGEIVTMPTHRMVTIGLACQSEEAYARRATFVTAQREMKPLGTNPFAAKRVRGILPAYTAGGKLEELRPGIRRDENAASAPYQLLKKRDIKTDDRNEAEDG